MAGKHRPQREGLETVDEKIKAWRALARKCGRTALDFEIEGRKTEAILEASMAAVYYAAALDAAYFGDLPELYEADESEPELDQPDRRSIKDAVSKPAIRDGYTPRYRRNQAP
jgi:hypothetical protein